MGYSDDDAARDKVEAKEFSDRFTPWSTLIRAVLEMIHIAECDFSVPSCQEICAVQQHVYTPPAFVWAPIGMLPGAKY